VLRLQKHIDQTARENEARDGEFLALLQTRKKDVEIIQHLTTVVEEQRQRIHRNRKMAGDVVNKLTASLQLHMRLAPSPAPTPESFLGQWLNESDSWRRHHTLLHGTVVQWTKCKVLGGGPAGRGPQQRSVTVHNTERGHVTVVGNFGLLLVHGVLVPHGRSWCVVALTTYARE